MSGANDNAVTFLDQLKMAASAAIDMLLDLTDSVGASDAEISVVISHKGTVQDSIVVGVHDLAHLSAILTHLQTAPVEVSNVTATTTGMGTTINLADGK